MEMEQRYNLEKALYLDHYGIQDECVTLVPRRTGSVDLEVRGGSQVGYEGVEVRRLDLGRRENNVCLGKYRWYLEKETTTAVIVEGLGQRYEVRLNGNGY